MKAKQLRSLLLGAGTFFFVLLAYYFWSISLLDRIKLDDRLINREESLLAEVRVSTYPELSVMPKVKQHVCYSNENCNLTDYFRKNSTKTYLINFWASWCKPCIDEMPALIKLTQKIHTGKFRLILISVDENYESMNTFLSKLSLSGDILSYWDPNQDAARYFGINKFPETLVVTNGLNIVQKIEGSIDWTREDIVEFLSAENNKL